MEWAILVVLLVLAIPIVGVWLVIRAVETGNRLDEMQQRLSLLESELRRVRDGLAAQSSHEAPPEKASEPEPLRATTPPTAVPKPHIVPPAPPAIAPEPVAPKPEPIPPTPAPPPLPIAAATAQPPEQQPPPPIAVPLPPRPAIDWEQFMGVKMFAWIGGLALFLGVVFFVKYSFEHNWISPQVRIIVGFACGIGLVLGGIRLSRKDYPTLAQTLCATGIVTLYAVSFAARSIYDLPFFDTGRTFLIMALVTATAFVLAVRFNALVVGILGMLGGFLTPILVHTGVDNPLGLFGYIAILDVGLLAVAARRRWDFLQALSAAGTVLMQIGWAAEFFVRENYPAGNKILVPMSVLLGFALLYLAAAGQAKRAGRLNWWLSGSVLGLVAAGFGFGFWFLDFPGLAARPALMFGFVLLLDLVVIALRWFDEACGPADALAGLVVFLMLASWTNISLQPALLNPALGLFLLFGVLHTALPIVRQRAHPESKDTALGQVFAPLALILVLFPIFRFTELSFAVWPVVLLIDLVAIGFAVVTAALLPVLVALLLTLVATAGLLLKVPSTLDGFSTFILLLGCFSAFFFAIGLWLTKRFQPAALRGEFGFGESLNTTQDLAAAIPLGSALFPFTLLIMATVRLPMHDPSQVFGLSLLLGLMLMALNVLFRIDWMPAIALAGVAAVEYAWHFSHFNPAHASAPLAWYLIFLGVFTVFPFLFVGRFRERVVPWAVAAAAGVPQFFLVHRLFRETWPNDVMGLLPAAFAVPPAIGLLLALKRVVKSPEARLAQLAWFAGVALFFVTLIFPVQFKRQWLTLGWALEGAALLWLFLKIPHRGLRWTGIGLLVIAFTRLTLNFGTLEYQRRGEIPIINWYLYTYGIVTACLFAGAWLSRREADRPAEFNPRGLLVSLGTILSFWLVNLEIFDYFTLPGEFIEIALNGNFPRDMTFSIAWALFALALLIIGIAVKQRAFRYAGTALLSVTLIKLFFHDLAQLAQLYRIWAFVGVAIIAMIASFAYQKFFSTAAKRSE